MGPLARDAGVHQTSTPRALTNTTGRGQRNRPFVTVVRENEKCWVSTEAGDLDRQIHYMKVFVNEIMAHFR